ncbi:substrate-binding domain-containing protein [Conexibacter sp. JD483]|uniref:sugar ABC transporter substrate-binding protein n=1 Tax=unclassified Conexibacter TaxID=2627773 RepID=UPI002716BDB9|nr:MULTISPECIES: substrate-binding domain-containing protein [unclassified Conexibacter]MDO8187833.1 substrate-binding domain-containing protein [Conexibacter sp. CPCC 205706]MDO8199958.1 substrate-binding domain-containing protein [Conexibacter sp. CPCC 205762]MDR9369485.1 substrate-binding domain-containing protein [Conexibacter sp. JD483]
MRGLAHWRRGLLLAVAALCAVTLLAACGSSSDDGDGGGSGGSSTQTKGEGIRAGSGSAADRAAEAGAQAARETGEPVELPQKTIGIVNFLNGIESSDRLVSTNELAARMLGWRTLTCDGRGTPTQFVACGNQMLDRGVDGIVMIAIEPGQVQQVLTKARAAGVPVIQTGGGAVPDGYDGNYGPDEYKAGEVLTEALLPRLDALPGDEVPIAVHDFPAGWARTRTDALRDALRSQSKVKITADTVTDGANLVPFTRKTVADQITQNPDLKTFWVSFDTAGQVTGQVVTSRYKGRAFPDRPLVVTFHADLGTIELMRKGDIDMTSEVNYDAGVWIGADNLAEFFARRTPMMQENQPTYPVIGDPFTYRVVTKDELPPRGEYVAPAWDIPAYFEAKWRAEFGL